MQLRLTTGQLLHRIAEHTGAGVVRTVRVLPPGTTTGTAADTDSTAPTAAPPLPPCEPSSGYLATRAAYQATKAHRSPAVSVRKARDRQTGQLLAHREPLEAFTAAADYQAELRERERRRAQDVQRRVERLAQADRAARSLPTITAPTAPANLERTA